MTAKVVFDSAIRCTVTGLDATTTVRFEQHDFDEIEHSGPLGIDIAVGGAEPGTAALTPASDGPARVVIGLDASLARSRVRERVSAGCRRAS